VGGNKSFLERAIAMHANSHYRNRSDHGRSHYTDSSNYQSESALSEAPASSKSRSQQRFYYPELDAIRLFLFIGVWSYHALPREDGYYIARHVPLAVASLITGVIRGGMCSLDVFFILSAFLITELLLREKDVRGQADLKMFYIRRLLRIWPLYFFVIGLAAILSIFDRSQPLSLLYAIAFTLFFGNWIVFLRGYPAASMIGPLWSVSFEEQFYLLWPLVLCKARKAIIYAIVGVMFAGATLVRLNLLLRHVQFGSLWYNTFVRLDSIACGILLALLLHGQPLRSIGRHRRVALLFFALFIWFIVGRYCGLHDPAPPLTGGLIGFPLMSLSGVVIFISVLGSGSDGLSLLAHPALVYLGKISYGLYAFHILALRCAYYLFKGYRGPFHMTLSSVTALALTLGMAASSFRWLESPFLRLKQQKFTYIPSGSVVKDGNQTDTATEGEPSETQAVSNTREPNICAASISGNLESAPIES